MNTLRAHVTEKAYATLESNKEQGAVYTFLIPAKMRKEEIKSLIEKQHSVTVSSINTITLPGKARRFRGVKGRTSDRRKALVRLKPGDRIASYEESLSTSDNQ